MSAPKPTPAPPAFADGHFYSPVVNPAEARQDEARIWPPQPTMAGIDMNDAGHLAVLQSDFPRFIGDYDYPEHGPADAELTHFYTQNSQFSWLDSRGLFVMMRARPPRRIIEVGSGYSSLLMADVNVRFLANMVDITCIEPFPRDFLRRGVDGLARVLVERVQDVSLDVFATLRDGDILFIDSSHVGKTGSDVLHLLFEVLPRLAPGVRIHIHDIFLPDDYPKDWVLDAGRSWNEQYLLRALLMDSPRYQVLFGCNYAFARFGDAVIRALAHPKGHGFGGGSFWIEIVA
jgi:predicted O-methyltransferase YrrM